MNESKYTFRYEYEGSVITVETDEVCLPDLLTQIRAFLLACGFQITGKLVESEEI